MSKLKRPSPIVINGSESDGSYLYEFPDPNDKDRFDEVLFADKKKADQKWVRQSLPETQMDWYALPKEERIAIGLREIKRRLYGLYMMISGELTYITGHHYFFLQYWYMDAMTIDGFPEYRSNHRYYLYFRDLCETDPKCSGDIFITQKRWAKTEITLACAANIATLGKERNKRFLLQALNGDIAKNNLFNRVVRSYNRLPWFARPMDDGRMNQGKKINLNYPSVKRKTAEATGKEPFGNTIEWAATVTYAAQGTRPKDVFLDEGPTIVEMDLGLWQRTTREQLRLGNMVAGKMHLPATVEDMQYRGAAIYQDIWNRSNVNDRDGNGETKSGLYRYFQPYWMGMEGFFDEYGNAKEKEIRDYVNNRLDSSTEAQKKQLKRQYPDNIEDVFEVPSGDTLESDVVEILKDHRKAIDLAWMTDQMRVEFVKMRVEGGEVYKTQYNVKRDDYEEQQKYIRLYEDPRAGVKYLIGIDGTGTDKETSGAAQASRSKFAIVVTKTIEVGVSVVDPSLLPRSYCDVAVFCVTPDKMEEMFHMAYSMFLYFNKFDNCWVNPEGNIGLGPNLLAYFENRGAKRHILKQPKFPGTDNRLTKNNYGTYRSGDVRAEQIRLTNIACRYYGRNLRDRFLITDLIQIGLPGQDPHIADAYMMAVLVWGDFSPERSVYKKKTEKRRAMTYKLEGGVWKAVWQ